MGAAQVNGAELVLDPILAWAAAVALLLSVGSSLWSIVGSSSRNNGRRIDEVSKRAETSENRLASVEQTLQGMPGKDDINLVQLSLAEMRGDLRVMQASMLGNNEIMKRLERIVTRHEDHLLDGAKR